MFIFMYSQEKKAADLTAIASIKKLFLHDKKSYVCQGF